MGFRDLYRANMEIEYIHMLKESNNEREAGNFEKARDLDIRAHRIIGALQEEQSEYKSNCTDEEERQLWARWDREDEEDRRKLASRTVWDSSVWRSARTVKPDVHYTSLFHFKYEGLLMCNPKIITNDLVAYDIDGSGVYNSATLDTFISRLSQLTYLPLCRDCKVKAIETQERRGEY